jgi:membrane-associated phospholipid phosphatase
MTIAWNHNLFLWLNQAFAALPDWLWSSLTITGHTSMMFALFGFFLLPTFKRPDLITALFFAAIIGGVASTVVKESFQIPRPPAALTTEQFRLIGHKLELVSFPSGHTLTAFGIGMLLILGLQLRGWRLAIVLALASLIALSRIAVGAHWPLDVLAGAALGAACGWAGWRTALWLHQRSWTTSAIYLSLQIGMIGAISVSLFATDMGYPAAKIWQLFIASLGTGLSVYSAYLLLKSFKLH